VPISFQLSISAFKILEVARTAEKENICVTGELMRKII